VKKPSAILDDYIKDIESVSKLDYFRRNHWRNEFKNFLNSLELYPYEAKQISSDLVFFSYLQNDTSKRNLKLSLSLLQRRSPKYRQKISKIPLIKLPEIEKIDLSDIPSKRLPKSKKSDKPSNKIFLVHGHDSKSVQKLKSLLETEGFDPIVLHLQTSQGQTIIEKFEKHANQAKFAIVLLTPDDWGGKTKTGLVRRARQNVILELGYFFGHLGRENVLCLHKSNVELPSDIHGILYIYFKKSPLERKNEILAELKDAKIKPNLEKSVNEILDELDL